jgi:glycosyltransferase involved in cell wall biosynthesis
MTESPRVLVVSNMYPSHADPIFGRFVSTYVAALTKAGARCTVVANTDPRKGATRFVKYLSLAWRSWRAARPGRFDLVHAHYAYPTALIARFVARRAHVPWIVTTPGSDVAPGARGLHAWTLRRVLPEAARVLVVSEHQGVTLRRSYGVPPDMIDVVSYGTDVASFAGRSAPEARARLGLGEGKHVVCVSRQVPNKGLDLLVEASTSPNATVHLLGTGPLADELNAQVKRLNAPVLIHGRVEQDDLIDWVAACDAFVLPSLSEGRPTVAIEALAAGKPVCGFDIPALVDLVEPGVTGFLAPVGSVDGLAKVIGEALASVGNEEACRRAAARFTPEAEAARTLSVYDAVLAGRG